MPQNLGTKFMLDGVEISVRERRYESKQQYNAKSMISTWELENAHPDLKASEDALPAPKMKGEDKENDNAYNKHNRLYAKRSRETAEKYVRKLIEAGIIEFAYADVDNVKFSFSRTAGCSCPCSPGVKVDSFLRSVDTKKKVDISINFRWWQGEDTNPAA